MSPARPLSLLVAVSVISVASFTSSARADDAACINSIETALTQRQSGKLHDALKTLTGCSDAACPAEVKAECTQRIDAITAAMPTLVLAAKDGTGNDLYAVTVAMDGAPLAASLDGRPLSLDPGEHTFHFETAGQPPVDKQLVLREGDRNRLETVVLGPPAPAVPVAVPVPASAAVSAAPGTWSTRKTLALVSGGVGLVGLGFGAAFGAFASSDQSKEQSNCGASACTNRPQSVEDYNTAQKNATGATIGIVAGGALVAAGVVLWSTAPSAPAQSASAPASARAGTWGLAPALLPSGGGLTLRGVL